MVCLCCKDELRVALKGPKGLWDTDADVLSAGGVTDSQSQTPRGSESLGVRPPSPVFESNSSLLCFGKDVELV